MNKIAILYICTGKYDIFWEGFYKSSEQYFLQGHTKEYFVFTDKEISYVNKRVHTIYQEKLGWPYDTLMRFKMFHSIKERLSSFDYIFFINANMRFLKPVNAEVLPNEEEGLLVVKHPGFFNKKREEFTYDINPKSLAFIPPDKGKYYFMGGFNGGKAKDYLQLIENLHTNINQDLENGIIAVWHDESHLNKYMLDRNAKILNPEYGYPEGWNLPFEKKIIILDKTNFGGHNFLRGNPKPENKQNFLSRIKSIFKKTWS